MTRNDCLRKRTALIDFIQQSRPNMLAGDYHQQLKNVPVPVLEKMKNAIEGDKKRKTPSTRL